MRVGRPYFLNLSYCKRDARRKRTARKKTPPHPPKNHGENTGKTRQGDPTHPEEKNATRKGGGKTRQGEPHQPREKRKNATRRRKEKKPKTLQNRLGKHLLALIQQDEVQAQLAAPTMGRASRQQQEQKQTEKKHS